MGEVSGDYCYEPGKILFHRRPVHWLNVSIDRAVMSEALRHSTGSIGTVSRQSLVTPKKSKYSLAAFPRPKSLISTDETVEDPSAFALEEHLEDFLVENWAHTELGKEYDIYEEEGEKAQQYQTDTGPLDILAISKDKKTTLGSGNVAMGQRRRCRADAALYELRARDARRERPDRARNHSRFVR